VAKKPHNYYDNKAERQVKIIPLGGLERIGMNITAFEYGNSIIIVDCGLAFPEEDMLGVDCVVPDITYLKQNIEKVKGIFITHGHDDHIGSIPYILGELNVPIYATRLTMAILNLKLEEKKMLASTKEHVVNYGDVVTAGDFKIEYIRVNHSILDAAALAITSPAGTIIHTGDFKIDYTPVFGDPCDLQRLGELGKQGVLALLSDSTNAVREGFTPSEKTIAIRFDGIFTSNQRGRLIFSTFSSHIDRVQQVINAASRAGRKVAIDGRSMVAVITMATEMGYITIPENTLVDIENISNYPDNEICIVMTGSQGEEMAALSRAVAGQHRFVNIKPNDVVVFSSSPIPGNEKAVSKLVNQIAKQGASVINKETHVSGHACMEEIKLMYALTKPKYAVPLHGEFRHRKQNGEIAKEMQIEKENVFLLNSGDVLFLSEERGYISGTVPNGGVMVDGLGVGDVGNIVLRDRQNLSQDGIIVVAIAISGSSGELVSGPEIISRGFVYVRDNETLMEEAKQIARDTVMDMPDRSRADWGRIKTGIREELGAYFWKLMRRNPVILPIIMEVE